jgi:nucleotide-binding universal stress UspA family protein
VHDAGSNSGATHPAPAIDGTVVVGVDGSAGGRAALRWAAEHAAGDLHAVRAVSPALELLGASFQLETAPLRDRARTELDDEVAEVAELRRGSDRAAITAHVVEDSPALAVLEVAHRTGARVIVVGANGHDRIGQLVGTTTGRLLHLSDVAVIVVPEHAPARNVDDDDPPPVVVGVGGRSESDRCLVDWVRSLGGSARYRLVHAVSPTLVAVVPVSTATDPFERGAEAHLARLLAGDERGSGVVVVDEPLSALADASDGAALVVIGSHRHGRTTGFLTGAIAQHLPAIATCPVVAVPIPDPSGER